MITRLLTWKELAILGGLAAALLVGSVTAYVLRPGAASPETETAAMETRVEETAPPTREPGPPQAASVPVGDAAPEIPDAKEPDASQEPVPVAAPPGEIVVEVKGAVMQPGVYRLKAGARVEDILVLAGGPTPDADLTDINRAARLIDSAPLWVPQHSRVEMKAGVLSNMPAAMAADLNPPEYTVSGWRRTSAAVAPTAPAALPGGVGASLPVSPLQVSASGGLVDLNTATREQLETLPRIGEVTAGKIIAYREQTPFSSVEELGNIPGIGEKTLDALRPLVTVGPGS